MFTGVLTLFFNLDNIALQASSTGGQSADNTLAIVTTLVGGFAAIAVPLGLSLYQQWVANKNREMDLFQNFTKQLTDLIEREGSLANKSQCEAYAWNYLDTLDQIAFLYNTKQIKKNIEYFENHFRYALTIRHWVIDTKNYSPPTSNEDDDRWGDLLKICRNFKYNEIPKDENPLPWAMRDYESLKPSS